MLQRSERNHGRIDLQAVEPERNQPFDNRGLLERSLWIVIEGELRG